MRINKAEVWEELNETNEAFVRRKYAESRYPPAKQKVVREWIAQRDAERQSRWAERTANWTRVAAMAAVMGVVFVAIQLLK